MTKEITSPPSTFEVRHHVLENGLLTYEEIINSHAVTIIPKDKTLVLKPFTIQHNDSHTRTLTMRPVVEVGLHHRSLAVSYPASTGIFLLGREGEPLTADAICEGQTVTLFGNQTKDSDLFVAKVILIHPNNLWGFIS